MSETEKKNAVDMGMIIAQSQENATQIAALREDLTNSIKEISQAVTSLGDTLHRRINETREASAPNFSAMAKWATVVISVVAMGGTLLGFIFQVRFEGIERATAVREAALQAQVTRLQDWHDSQVAAELQELRERRRGAAQ